MKITIEQVPEGGEPEIILRCNDPDEALLARIYSVNAGARKLIGMIGLQMHTIHPRDVYYFEAVDHKVFINCQEKVYESRLKLYELETEYESAIFSGHPNPLF
ncbi:LytTR family DNA-binding domain-containing protein [Paenibacillus sp. FSL H8-0332]|uniref:LytTR family DNA-binding domain-containing protein n=1 Tax=Paenibacillus sp. FSL H8-0332 TaxID=2954742 RepID=UPI0030D32FC0